MRALPLLTLIACAHAPAAAAPTAGPTAEAAVARLLPPLRGDAEFTRLVAESLREQGALAAAAEAERDTLQRVAEAVRAEGLPELLIGLPLYESGLDSAAVSPWCAAGIWQFMPQTAARFGLEVRDCRLRGQDTLYTPDPTDQFKVREQPYVQGGHCAIERCAVDERLDTDASTRAALALYRDSASDPALAEHPLQVALAVLAHNAGRRTVSAWVAARGDAPFTGLAACQAAGCDGLSAESARYLPAVVAATATAICALDPADPLCRGR